MFGKDGVGGKGRKEKDDLLEQAKSKREERQRLRLLLGPVLRIQRWYRGRRDHRRERHVLLQGWDKQLKDYQGLRKMLAAQGVPFAPPVAFSMSAMGRLLFLLRRAVDDKEDSARLCTLCGEVLIPSLAHQDTEVNFATSMVRGGVGGVRLLSKLLRACLTYVGRHWDQGGVEDGNHPLKVLLMLSGCERHAQEESGIIGQLGTGYDMLASAGVTDVCVRLLTEELHVFGRVRQVFFGDSSSYSSSSSLSSSSGTDQKLVGLTLGGRSRALTLTAGRRGVMQGCWELAVQMVVHASSRGIEQRWLQAGFVANILSIPVLTTCLASVEVIRQPLFAPPRGADDTLYLTCLKAFLSEKPPLPPSPTFSAPSVAFLLGNLSELQALLPLDLLSAPQTVPVLRVFGELFLRPDLPEALLTEHQAVTWRTEGGKGASMTAMAVPEQVQGQTRMVLADTTVRGLVGKQLASVDAHRVLARSTAAEERVTRSLAEASAATLAVASVYEQKAEEDKWVVSKWAARLRKSVTARFKESAPPKPIRQRQQQQQQQKALNCSAISRAAALGKVEAPAVQSESGPIQSQQSQPSRHEGEVDEQAVLALVQLLAVLLWRWDGLECSGGRNRVVEGLLNTLCFSTPIVPKLWAFLQSDLGNFSSSVIARARILRSSPYDEGNAGGMQGLFAVLAVFATAYAHMMAVLDDTEIYSGGVPLPLHQVRRVVSSFKQLIFTSRWQDWAEQDQYRLPGRKASFGEYVRDAMERLMRALHERSSRKPLCPADAWLVDGTDSAHIIRELKAQTPRARHFLAAMPFAVPLTERMRIFAAFVQNDKAVHQPQDAPGIRVRIRRGALLEDGLAALNKTDGLLKKRLSVVYVSHDGYDESGIDMGGLFKDFWTDLSGLAFDLQFGLWQQTENGGLLYPNAHSSTVHGQGQHLRLFEFLGRILGKALYEGITVQPKFAAFFLARLRGNYNYLNLFHDLAGLDADLYRNLVFLKREKELNIEDLCLTFTVTDEDFGVTQEVNLVPRGGELEVTQANKVEYINRVAKYHLVDKHKEQADAFVRGMWSVIPHTWLQMFSVPELQILISGSSDALDAEDLKKHTRYAGGFLAMDKHVRRFWRVVGDMSPAERAALLRFVTSCERPPPLGFESMVPPFTIQRVGVSSDDERLPTASTCFNTLKLPTYTSEKVLKEKLFMSIFSGTGFELS